MKRFFTLLFSCSVSVLFAQKQAYLLVGTYTGGKSKGISVYRFNSQSGSATLVDTATTTNPSYLAVSPNKKYVYAVNELGEAKGGGKVTAFRFEKKNGQLTQLNQQPSMGADPCYVTVDNTGRWVIVGNYSSGTVAVLPAKPNGSLNKANTFIQHTGHSVHARQQSPHVHSTVLSPDNRYLFVADLGLDKILIYAFNQQNGNLTPKDSTLLLQAGSGPRHFVFHPNGKWAYLVQELAGTVTVFRYNDGTLQPVQTTSVLPNGFSQSFTSADIHVSPDGRFLYTSTRDEANLMSIFSINAATGQLTAQGYQPVLGKTPRNFSFDPSGNFLLVANQNSDEVVVFKVNRKTGALSDTGKRIAVGNPVCLKWITP